MTERSNKKETGKTTVRMPEDVHHRAKVVATDLKRPLQNIVAEAVEEWLSKRGYSAKPSPAHTKKTA